jgi:hypothetical protein
MTFSWTFTNRAFLLAICSSALVICASAAPSIATVTSAVPFTLDGHPVSTPGVTSFPLVVGDTVATTAGPAVLFFQDGSRVKLGPNSSVKLAGFGAKPKVVLLSGALDFKLIPGSNVSVVNLDAERKQTGKAAVSSPALASAHPDKSTESMVASDAKTSASSSTPSADPTTAPVAIATSAVPDTSVASSSKLTSPEFLVPAIGGGAAGLSAAIFKLQTSGSSATSNPTAVANITTHALDGNRQ